MTLAKTIVQGIDNTEIVFKNFQFCITGVRSSAMDQTLKSTEITVEIVIFRRNATHCISPYAIVKLPKIVNLQFTCVCVCVYVSVCVFMPRLWTS